MVRIVTSFEASLRIEPWDGAVDFEIHS